MQTAVQVADKFLVANFGIVRNFFEIERDATVSRDSAEEAHGLIEQRITFRRVFEDIANSRIEVLLSHTEIAH